MIKHIVIWQMREGVSDRQKQEMKGRLEALIRMIPQLLRIEVGIASGSETMSLYSEFTSKAALEVYQKHPAHQEVVASVRKLVAERSVCDYEC